jgi:hypothetical protein
MLLTVAVLLLTACFGGDPNPIEEDPGEAGVTIDVVGCERDEVTGNVMLTFELTSENEYQSVLVNGEVRDASGTVLAPAAPRCSRSGPARPTAGTWSSHPPGRPRSRAS